MQMIEQFAQGTAAAQTAAAGGGTPTTPQAVAIDTTAVTSVAGATQTPSTPTTAATVAVATTAVVGTQVIAVATTPVAIGTVPTSGPKPTSYTLQQGEFPYCIARRYNVNPDELLSRNNLTAAQSGALMPGLVLSMPQTGDPFPSDRALHSHPDSFTVDSSDTTVNGVACYYGDIDPQSIATANGISVSSALISPPA